MRPPFAITATSPRPGFDPATVNMRAESGPDAHALARSESNDHPDAVVTVWKRMTVEPEQCGECHRPKSAPVNYRPVCMYLNGVGTVLYTPSGEPAE